MFRLKHMREHRRLVRRLGQSKGQKFLPISLLCLLVFQNNIESDIKNVLKNWEKIMNNFSSRFNWMSLLFIVNNPTQKGNYAGCFIFFY